MGRLLRSPLHAAGSAATLARRLPPRARRWILIAVLVGLLALGGWMLLLRDSSLFSADKVTVSGLSGDSAPQVEAALTNAAHGMSTMHVDVGRLRSAVASFRVVKELHVSTSFPHAMRIRVVERLPVAVLSQGDQRLPLAADGTILAGALAPTSLPTLRADTAVAGARVGDRRLLEQLTLLGAAPVGLRSRVARVFAGPAGLTVALRSGVSLYFGDATRPRAKWLSVARVLADASAAGAGYVDVRLPDRPAASVPGAASAATASSGATGAATTTPTGDPNSQALAAALAQGSAGAAGGGASGSVASGAGAGAVSGAPAGAGTSSGLTTPRSNPAIGGGTAQP